MKKSIIVLLLTFVGTVYIFAQDQIILNDEREYPCRITRINQDSVYFLYSGSSLGYPLTRVKNVSTLNKFKKYLITNPESIGKDDAYLNYTNYCLNKYRRQQNAGRVIMLGGSVLAIAGSFGTTIDSDDNVSVSPLVYIGGATALIGYFVDWNSLRWLKNLQVAPEYTIGLGYTFEF